MKQLMKKVFGSELTGGQKCMLILLLCTMALWLVPLFDNRLEYPLWERTDTVRLVFVFACLLFPVIFIPWLIVCFRWGMRKGSALIRYGLPLLPHVAMAAMFGFLLFADSLLMPDGADGKTFSRLWYGFTKDADRVWYRGDEVPGADAASFERIDGYLAKDKNRYYFERTGFEVSDPASFRVFDEHYRTQWDDFVWAIDKDSIYFIVSSPVSEPKVYKYRTVDYDGFQIVPSDIGYPYAKDKQYVYCGHGAFPDADPESFHEVDIYGETVIAQDKYRVYAGCRATPIQTYHRENWFTGEDGSPYYRDGENVYDRYLRLVEETPSDSVSAMQPEVEPTPVVIRDQDIPEQYLKKEYVYNGLKVPYRIAETNAGKTAEKAVLVLFLHGTNGMGTDNEKPMQLEPGPKYLYKHFYKKGERAIVVVPQLANGSWKSYGKALKALLDELIASDKNIDPRRVYVTGTSLGGYGTLDMVRLFPNFFAAAMPVAIKAPTDWTGLTTTPLCIVSGRDEGDQTVRINALQKQGGTVMYKCRPEANHGYTCQSSFTEDCLKWVFGFKRK